MKDFIKRKLKDFLDNYYSEILGRELRATVMLKMYLNVRTEEFLNYNIVKLEAKPVKYKDYTTLYIWKKSDSFKLLLELDDIKKEIDLKIKNIEEGNTWY